MRQYEIFINCSQLAIRLLVFESNAYFLYDVDYFWTGRTFSDWFEEIGQIFLVEIVQKIRISMAEVADMLLIKSERIHKQEDIRWTVLILTTNLNQFFQDNMLLLYIIIF